MGGTCSTFNFDSQNDGLKRPRIDTQHLRFDTPEDSSLDTRSTSPAPERNTGVDEDLLSEGIQFVQDTGTQQLRGRMNSYVDRRSVLASLFSMHRNIEPRCSE